MCGGGNDGNHRSGYIVGENDINLDLLKDAIKMNYMGMGD